MSDVAIRVENLGKLYHIGGPQARYKTIRESIQDGFKAPFRRAGRLLSGKAHGAAELDKTIWALKDVSFEVKQGEVIGIIGRNGAGKSTLLKILSRITEPTEGEVMLRGRVGSLLEVGTGFHPELTGRENIYLNGAILGMKREEIDRKFEEIIEFSGIEKFIDTPVKHYSSGMYVRLAFSVAAHLEPEILLVDEVLAVGDAAFQKKCLGKMSEVASRGRTVLFVSHNMNAVEQLCSSGILLSDGRILLINRDIKPIVDCYLTSSLKTSDSSIWTVQNDAFDNPWFKPQKFYLSDNKGNLIKTTVRNDSSLWIQIEGEVSKVNSSLLIGYGLFDSRNTLLYSSWQIDGPESDWPIINGGTCTLVTEIPKRLLNEGTYRIELYIQLRYSVLSKRIICPSKGDIISIGFTIEGGLSDSPIWNAKRPGFFAPVMNWWVSTE